MKTTALYPSVRVDTAGRGIVSHAGGLMLTETVRASGLGQALSVALARWRPGRAVHDPGKVLCDLALSLALGGDCLADVSLLRAEPAVFGRVASDPTVSRTVDRLACDVDRALKAIDAARALARALARAQVWALAGSHAPHAGISADDPLVIDLDATLVTAHSEKENADRTWKKGFGGANTAADHVTVAAAALTQLPRRLRRGRSVLIRTDSGGGTHAFVAWLHQRRLAYSVGTLPESATEAIAKVPAGAWTPAYDGDGQPRDGAWVAELTGLMDLSGWPEGIRVIVRKERPHPGAQLRIIDPDGNRCTAFATNTRRGQLADLELRHRRRARREDRIRTAKDTDLTNLPLHDFAQNPLWCAVVALALDLLAWTQMLALTGHTARRWEPKRLRHRLFTIAGRVAHHARTTVIHLPAHHPWAALAVQALTVLSALPNPG